MTLVNRVSSFFLAALALSLVGNALLVCGIVWYFLSQKFDQQLHSALHTLVAAVEVEDDDVKWEPSDHTIGLGAEDGLDDIRWVVLADSGKLVDHSRNLDPALSNDLALLERMRSERAASHATSTSSDWHFLDERLAAPDPKPESDRESKEFAALRVVVARSPQGLRSNLLSLATLLAVLTVAIWLAAALGGAWYCRKALRPVRDMADRARSVEQADFHARLPPGAHADELADLSTAFNGLLDRLQNAFEKQRRFTGDAAHQLRTPLTVLLGQIDVTLRRPRTPDEYRQTLTLLRSQTHELEEIVEALLYLARAEGDTALPGVESRDMNGWLTQYVDRWKEHPRHRDLALRSEPRVSLVTSWPLLTQLLDNLLGNAFKYSEPGTSVTLSAYSDGDDVVFDVADLGIGIPTEDRDAIFDPFFRSRTARQSGVGGTGLGLSIAAGIARALHGRLICSGSDGPGTHFQLILPQTR